VRAAAQDLSNFRPVSNDEVELIEVGYTLASHGVLGSPMYAGFFNAETHHLWTLPVQHALDAAVFSVLGVGVLQARWLSVVAAVVTLWCAGWFALRWYGLAAAILAETLLVFWRSNLTAGATGLPLLDVSRVARYDVLALAFGWLAMLTVQHRYHVAAGVCGGLAALSQFFGIAALPVLLVGGSHLRWRLLAAACVIAPWLAYLAAYREDLAGQWSVYGQRGDFLRPTFYVQNVLNEPNRYVEALTPLIPTNVVLIVGVVASTVWLVLRGRNPLLLAYLFSAVALLAVADSTKTPLYAILLVPPMCVALPAAWSALRGRLRLWWWLATLLLLVPIMNDGLAAYAVDRAEAAQVTPYADVGQRIENALPPDGVVLGPERWWWPMHERPYISLRSLWFQWTSRNGQMSFADLAATWQPTGLIVSNNVRDDVRAFPATLQDQFWTFVDRCTELAQTIDDPTYFQIDVYRVLPACR
jgi:hypothetical protein